LRRIGGNSEGGMRSERLGTMRAACEVEYGTHHLGLFWRDKGVRLTRTNGEDTTGSRSVNPFLAGKALGGPLH